MLGGRASGRVRGAPGRVLVGLACSTVLLVACAEPSPSTQGTKGPEATQPTSSTSPVDSSAPTTAQPSPGSSAIAPSAPTTTTAKAFSETDCLPAQMIDPWNFESYGLFAGLELAVVSGFTSYTTTASFDLQGLEMEVDSDTAGRFSWHRLSGDPLDEEVPTGDWIITPGGAWIDSSGEWVHADPEELDDAWAIALAPWQLSSPATVYTQVYETLSGLDFAGCDEMEGRLVARYSGGPDSVGAYFGEEAGAVVSGGIEVWMDPKGFPMKVVTEATELHDLSVPRSMHWALTGLGTSIELEIPDEIAAETESWVPLLAAALPDRPCPEDATDGPCDVGVTINHDGRWTIDDGYGQETGPIDPNLLQPLKDALSSVDYAELGTLIRNGTCPRQLDDQGTVFLFPSLPSYELYASCRPFDENVAPYQEAMELISRLPMD